jgi:hypothetical protein
MGPNAALIEHLPPHFAVPPGRGGEVHTLEVTLFSGRSMDAKRALYQAIVRNLAALGVPALDIKIALIETPPEKLGRARRSARIRNRPWPQDRGVADCGTPNHARMQACLRATIDFSMGSLSTKIDGYAGQARV